jgi:hypothetical protein
MEFWMCSVVIDHQHQCQFRCCRSLTSKLAYVWRGGADGCTSVDTTILYQEPTEAIEIDFQNTPALASLAITSYHATGASISFAGKEKVPGRGVVRSTLAGKKAEQ